MPAPNVLLPPVEDGPWAKGIDSFLEATQVQKSFYRWAINVSNKGGVIRTRPGISVIPVTDDDGEPLIGQPRGMTVFTDGAGRTYLVVAVGTHIIYKRAPFDSIGWTTLPLSFAGTGPVVFVRCIQSVTEDNQGNLTDINPVPMLIIQDGVSRAAYWDGTTARTLNPIKEAQGGPSETPIGLWGEWSGNRYWVANGPRVRASNLMNPLKFTEEDLLEEGGFLTFSGNVTAMRNSFNLVNGAPFTTLLVWTDMTTSTVQSAITDRTTWGTTPGFQSVTLPGIGCVGGFAVATQWGIIWWYSHDGLIASDEGLRAYQVSKVTYHDREMAWSKFNISRDFKSGIAMGSFENILMTSVPSGDKYNAQTWVLDEAPLDVLTYWGYFGLPAWSSIWEGIRPVCWVTAPVDGVNRTFCLSWDYNGQNNVWEVATGCRLDYSVDENLNQVLQPIRCSMETKLIGYDGQYKYFRFAEIYLDNIEGEVDLTVSYAPRRGGYKKVLQKHIVASDWIIQNPTTQIVVPGGPPQPPMFFFDPVRSQSRVVRTISEAKTYTTVPGSGDDIYQGVETSANVPFPHQKDYGFSLLIQWTGRMSITNVRCYFDAEEQEVEGTPESDEATDRFVDVFGFNEIAPTLTPYVIDPEAMDYESNTIVGAAAIWSDMNPSDNSIPFYRAT